MQCRPAVKRACVKRKNLHRNVSRSNNYSSLAAALLLAATPAFAAHNDPTTCFKYDPPTTCHVPATTTTNPSVWQSTCTTPPRAWSPPPEINRHKFIQNVRKVQHRTNCTTKTCLEFIQFFEQYVGGDLPKGFVKCDKTLKKAAGIDVIELNGCAKCHGHVYGPDDKRAECPCCGAARYDVNGKANEVFFIIKYICMYRYIYSLSLIHI